MQAATKNLGASLGADLSVAAKSERTRWKSACRHGVWVTAVIAGQLGKPAMFDCEDEAGALG
jgi:hypothetical protein